LLSFLQGRKKGFHQPILKEEFKMTLSALLEERKKELIKKMNARANSVVVLSEKEKLLPPQEETLREKGYNWKEIQVPSNISLGEQKKLAKRLSEEVDVIIFTPSVPLPLVKMAAEATYEWCDPGSGYGQKAVVFVLLPNGELV